MKHKHSKFDKQISPIYISSRLLSPKQSKHEHNFYEILHIISGERYFFIGDRIYHGKEGDLLCIPPHTLHTATVKNSYNCECILLYLSDKFITGELLDLDKLHLKLPLKERDLIRSELEIILKEQNNKHYGYKTMMYASVLKLSVNIKRIEESETSQIKKSLGIKHDKIEEVLSYINRHLYEELSQCHLAEQFNISRPYLSRIFKEVTNYNFVEYINCLRVAEAKKLLKNRSLKIIDISEDVGFGSITHFGRVFKQITGTAPGSYRKAEYNFDIVE